MEIDGQLAETRPVRTADRCRPDPAAPDRGRFAQSREFFDGNTVPIPNRGGFYYPRWDSRLQDGDEVQLRSRWNTWIAFERRPNSSVIALDGPDNASTLIVHREKSDLPRVALLCKGAGRYLAADNSSGRMGCSSVFPWYVDSSPAGSNSNLLILKSASTSHILRAAGSKVVLDGSSRQFTWKIFLTGGCETIRPLLRGVNLGNWFVLEKWMAAYLFRGEPDQPIDSSCRAMDEYGLMSSLGPEAAKRRMEEHWGSWITEEDIWWIAGHGLNAVRVPFGYWMTLPERPFVGGQLKYMERLFKWCEKYSVGVLLDFHGLKGSQNGNPTSGNCGGCGNPRCGKRWIRFLDEQEANLKVIQQMVARFSKSPAYIGFAVANEVSTLANETELMRFYEKAYNVIRTHDRDSLVVLYSTFNPSRHAPFASFQHTWQDVHVYYAWGMGRPSLDPHENFLRARDAITKAHRWPVIVGEWSLAANGHDSLHWEPHRRDAFMAQMARVQLQAFETYTMGWFYWNYKSSYHNSTWNYRSMCRVGWVPGCTSNFVVSSIEWWKTSLCEYAYLDGACPSNAPSPLEFGRPENRLPMIIISCSIVLLLATAVASCLSRLQTALQPRLHKWEFLQPLKELELL